MKPPQGARLRNFRKTYIRMVYPTDGRTGAAGRILKTKGKPLPDSLLIQAKKTVLPTAIWPNCWPSGEQSRPSHTPGRRGSMGGAGQRGGNKSYYFSTYNGRSNTAVKDRLVLGGGLTASVRASSLIIAASCGLLFAMKA